MFDLHRALPSLLLAALAACAPPSPGGGEAPSQGAPGERPAPPPPEVSGEPAPPLAKLGLSFRPGAEAEVVPEEILVIAPRPLAPESESVAGIEVTLEPGGVGGLEWRSPRTLAVRPAEPLPPETEVRLTVASLPTRRGPSAGAPLEHHFRTPSMALHELRPERIVAGRAELRLEFTGPVRPDDVRRHLELSLGGRSPKRFEVGAVEGAARAVALTVFDRLVGTGPALELRLRRGIAQVGFPEHQVDPVRRSVELGHHGTKMRVMNAVLEETATGWLVRVVCTDAASGKEDRYFWDKESGQSYRLSPRCVLDEASVKARLHLAGADELRVSGTRGGFRVFAELPVGPTELVIEAGATTVDGGVLESTFRLELDVPRRSPKLDFAATGRYLPRSALSRVPVRSLNVERAKVRVFRVPPENMVFWASGSEDATPRTADPVSETEIALPSPADEVADHVLDLRPHLGEDLRGLFEIELVEVPPEGEPRRPEQAVLRVVATDLVLVAKRADGEVHAWALDAHTLAPEPGVAIRLVQPSGTARAAPCETGGDGGCVLRYEETNARGVELDAPFGLLAETSGGDLAHLVFDEVRTPTGEAEVSGVDPSALASPYRAAAWTDRGVYRPGETAHFAAALWADGPHAPPAGLPVKLRVLDPRGQETATEVVRTRPSGAISRDFPFPPTAPTGRYRVEFRVGERLLGVHRFSVEAFVPERMRVTAEPVGAPFGPDAPPRFRVGAKWLFGGSAEGSRVELRCRLDARAPSFEAFSDYRFGPRRFDGPGSIDLGATTAQIGDAGSAELSCPPPGASARMVGSGLIFAEALVFEGEGGRSTRASARAFLYDAPLQVGLRSDRERIREGEPVRIDGVVVGTDGALAPRRGPVTVELFRVERERDWSFDEATQRWTFRDHHRLSLEAKAETRVEDGRFFAELTPTRPSSQYLVRATAEGATGEITRSGFGSAYYDWAWGQSSDRTPRPGAPTEIRLEAPAEVKMDEAFEVTAEIPFAGRALFALETDRVIRYEWRDVKPGKVSLPFVIESPGPNAGARLVPNAYVTVVALKDPHEASDEAYVPARGFGARSVKVRPEPLILPLALELPSELRSSAELEIGVRAEGASADADVFVAVVDEGVLSLTGFETPNPLAELFAKRALAVDTFETAGWSLVLPAGGSGGRTGGGAGEEPGAVMPVEPVALWSGAVPLKDGRAAVRFELPSYRGRLRVMAVAVDPRRLGRAEAGVVVRDPVVLEPTVPRALTLGDEVEIPVFVSNVSGAEQAVRVTLEAEALGPDRGGVDASADPASLVELAPASRAVTLADGRSETVWFRAKAKAAAGAVKLHARGRFGEETTEAAQTLALRPDRPSTRHATLLRVTGDLELAEVVGPFVPGTETTRFVLTRNPFIESAPHLEALLDYPFGCAEQTTSRLRALLMLDRFGASPEALKRRPKKVGEGVRRLLSMQSASGGFGFWPGSRDVRPWPTAYVLDGLLDLRDAGFEVPAAALERGLTWAAERVERTPRPGLADAYLHYVLAKAQRPRRALAEKALGALGSVEKTLGAGPAREARSLLLAARYLAGDRRVRTALVDLAEGARFEETRRHYYSARRREALELALLAELFPEAPWLRGRLTEVAGSLERASAYYTTQELAWTITAVGRFVGEGSASGLPEAQIESSGRALSPETSAAPGTRAWTVLRASERPKLRLEFEGALEAPAYLLAISEGVRPDATWRSGGDGLSVSRTLRDASGEVITGPVPLGALVYSVIELKNLGPRRLEDVALVDPFPAGLEAVNPRLTGLSAPAWLPRGSAFADHTEYLDDRTQAFGDLRPRRDYVFWTPLRAVTAGPTQSHPPVTLEAMYNPERWAAEIAPPVEITR